MGLDKIKHNPPGLGPADTHSAGGPLESDLARGERSEGPHDPSRSLRDRGDHPGRSGRGRGRESDHHPRVQSVLNEGKHKVQQLLERTGDALGLRGREHTPPGQAKKHHDVGETPQSRDTRQSHSPSHEDGGHGRSHEARGHGRSHEAHGRGDSDHGGSVHGSGRGEREHGRSDFRPNSTNPNGNANGFDNSHGRGPHDTHGRGASDLLNDAHRNLSLTSVIAHLRGGAGGEHIPRELRQVLDSASRVLGSDLLAALERRGPSGDVGHAVKIIEHALASVARTLERVAEAGGSAAANVPPRVYGEAVGELLAATMLDKHFRKAEATGGRVVAQAEAALARLLYGDRPGGGGGRPGDFGSPGRPGPGLPAPHPLEVLRDLQTGAFRPPEVGRSPFPLTGRALVATEMMEMMRTLDAADQVMRELLATTRNGGAPVVAAFGMGEGDETPLLTLLRVLAGTPTSGAADVLDELLATLTPALPGRAARMEIPRLVAALGGVLADAEGRALVTKDGAPLKLDQLMWMGSLGGVLKSLGGAGAESLPVRLSPLLIYGFDAVYSLIGFDGRTLNPPHFAAVQAQVNGSELEWVYGQPPLSEGWMRALIERLKDSAQADHNLLGEMLEEALAEGRFHAALVCGTVSEGEAQPDTFAVTRLLPATA